MALTQISTDGIKNGTIATADLADSAVSTAKIANGAVSNAKIVDGAINNAKVVSDAAIAGSKISPDFGSQLVDCGQVNVTGAQPRVRLLDSDNNPDYSLRNNNGTFEVHDDNAPNARFTIDDSKIVSKLNHDFDAGIDVTGAITASTSITASGNLTTNGNFTISSTNPNIFLTDTDNDSDFRISNSNGVLEFRDLTNTSTRFQINSDGSVLIPTNSSLKIGASQDLEIFHSPPSSNLIRANNGDDIRIRCGGDNMISINDSGSVSLSYDGSTKFATTSAGVDITGNLHVDDLPNTTTNTYLKIAIQDTDGTLKSDDTIKINPAQDALSVNGMFINSNTVRASGNGPVTITTANASGTVDLVVKTSHVECNGNFLPQTNNTDDLGSTSLRWANIYTNDLNLSNEGSSNDVDGTWGSYTIQEGEESLFLINKRNGKKYRFNLTEVS